MKIILNYRKGNPRLKEGLESAGHETIENIWDINGIAAQQPSAVIFEFKYIFKDKWHSLPLIHKLKKLGIPSVTWNLDSPWHAGIGRWKVNFFTRSGQLSIYASHSLQETEKIRKTRVVYLPNAAWTSRYNLHGTSIEDLRRNGLYKWDVSFVGNIDKERYREHRARAEFLDSLGALLKKRGISFLFIDSGNLSYDEQIDIVQKSRINLSCISAADSMHDISWGLPERCYGIPACGGFLLMENRIHAKDDFLIGEEVVAYGSITDCEDKIVYYLGNHDERRRIAEKAHLRVMRDHTYKNRAEKLVAAILSLKDNVHAKKN